MSGLCKSSLQSFWDRLPHMPTLPQHQLRALVRELRGFWRTRESPLARWVPDRSHLAALSVRDLREASATFSANTAQSLDGFHPSHFGWLSDDALRVIAILLLAMECVGGVPGDLA